MARSMDEDELIEHWTLIGDEPDLLASRTGPSKLALALWLKFFTQHGYVSGLSRVHDIGRREAGRARVQPGAPPGPGTRGVVEAHA